MKKYFLNIVALSGILLSSTAYSQNLPNHETSEKVLVNPSGTYTTPARTLDVNGGVRLATPGEYGDNVIPLAIKSDKQVVLQAKDGAEPLFERRTYKIEVKDKEYGERVWQKDLGIDPRKYSASILSVGLYREVTKDGKKVLVPAVPSTKIISETNLGKGGPWENAICDATIASNGWIGAIGRNDTNPDLNNNDPGDYWTRGEPKVWWAQNNITASSSGNGTGDNRNFVFYAVPKIHVSDIGLGSYHFWGDLRDSRDSYYNARNYWVVDVLIIKNTMMSNERFTTIEGDVENNGGAYTFRLTDGEFIN